MDVSFSFAILQSKERVSMVSTARIDDATLCVTLLRVGAIMMIELAPGVGIAIEIGISLVAFVAKRIQEDEVLRASQLLKCLDATWDLILLKKKKHKYLSNDSAKHFVELVKDVVCFELKCRESRFSNPFSKEKKRLEAEVDALKNLKFEKVCAGA